MDNSELHEQRSKDFYKKASAVFGSESGKDVLNYLKESYVDVSSIGETPELTYYKLGQKELVQYLILFIESSEESKEVDVITGLD